MNAADFRDLFEYHFMQNRRLWERSVMKLTEAQYHQALSYSLGSIHNQMVHLMDIDKRWFQDLRGEDVGELADPAAYPDRASLRAAWDTIEAEMRAYLAGLHDEDLQRVITIETRSGEHLRFKVWQGLIHVTNHGTDHRAQILAMLHSLGITTFAQDFADWFFEPA